MIIPELKQLQLKQEAVSIWRDCGDEWLTGIVCKVDELVTAMHLYHSDGPYDGLTVFETGQIDDVSWGNREHRAITKQIAKMPQQSTPKFDDSDFFTTMLKFNDDFGSLCVYAYGEEDRFQLGKIVKYDERWLKLDTFGTMKTLSKAHRLILRETVSRIVVNFPYQIAIEELHAAAD